ncbi:MAG: hypothetical protein KUG75_15305 [Pseudomonadales bacterium]|nr:hypothetical protein [Pseudomonadales bacterium]
MNAIVPKISFLKNGWLPVAGTLLGYAAVILSILILWSIRDQNLIRAADGLGYWLGVCGSILMLLLLIYPLRKRMRLLNKMGTIKFWFQMHMVFGVVGPVMVLFHSNFNLGSLNGRIALFCTLIVASSGLIGRYLYAKFHYGMHGQRATLNSLRSDTSSRASVSTHILPIVDSINEQLRPYEERVLARADNALFSIVSVFTTPWIALGLKRKLNDYIHTEINKYAQKSKVLAQHEERLTKSARQYLVRRLSSYTKLAQLTGCERLFGLWHIVHFPLFLVMVFAALVHIFAVHAY